MLINENSSNPIKYCAYKILFVTFLIHPSWFAMDEWTLGRTDSYHSVDGDLEIK